MSTHNAGIRLAEGSTIIKKTASATLTYDEVFGDTFIQALHASVAIALTLPAASAALAGARCRVGSAGAAAVTVVVAAGFGGVGSGGDTVTLAQGEMADLYCDGSYWYVNADATLS